ncbi:hypothetical protein [Acinetobacter puyangensis]|uniref:hypothetical protein n=1 Tax=Acinetobacter puyangensis TaxID=1096779 RepID=UPI003A4D2878
MSNTDINTPTPLIDSSDSKTPVDTKDKVESPNTSSKASQLLSPTVKGALIGAVAGHFLPVFNTVTGAIVGGITAKVLNRQHTKKHAFQS